MNNKSAQFRLLGGRCLTGCLAVGIEGIRFTYTACLQASLVLRRSGSQVFADTSCINAFFGYSSWGYNQQYSVKLAARDTACVAVGLRLLNVHGMFATELHSCCEPVSRKCLQQAPKQVCLETVSCRDKPLARTLFAFDDWSLP